MKSILLFLTLALSSIGLSQNSEFKLELGAKIPSDLIPSEPQFMLTPSFLPFFEFKREGVTYQILYDDEKRIVRYIQTSDSDFTTSDGKFVGQCVQLTKEQLNPPTSGTTVGAKSPDGWIPIFGYHAHVVTCQKDDDDSAAAIPRSKMFSDSDMIKLKIIRFTKGLTFAR